MVRYVLALSFFCQDCYQQSLPRACRRVFRWLRPFTRLGVPGRSTLCEARQRLGVGPLVQLAKDVVTLLATEKTPGAFHRGLRLMAIDALRGEPAGFAGERSGVRPAQGWALLRGVSSSAGGVAVRGRHARDVEVAD